jgi:hypothetical protein
MKSVQFLAVVKSSLLACTVLTLGSWGAIKLGMKAADIAAWVQAVGSIGAIVFASLHATNQLRSAERLAEYQRAHTRYDKLDSIFAIAQAAREHVDTIANGLVDGPDGPLFNGLTEFFDVRLVQVTGHALGQIPLHELGSSAMVRGVINLQLAVRSAEHALLAACSDEAGRRDPDEYIDAANSMRGEANAAMEMIKRALREAGTF